MDHVERVEHHIAKLRKATKRAEALTTAYRERLVELQQLDRKATGTERLAEMYADAEANLRDMLASLRAEIAESVDVASRALAKMSKTGSAEDRLLAELREQRAWRRAERRLTGETPVSLHAIVAEARATGDAETLRALRAEVPSLAEALYGTSTGLRAGLPDPSSLGDTLRMIDDALVDALPEPEAGVMRAQRDLADAEATATRAVDGAERVAARWTRPPAEAAESEELPSALAREARAAEIAEAAHVRSMADLTPATGGV